MAILLCLMWWGILIYSAMNSGVEIPIYSDEIAPVQPDELWYLNPV